MQNAFPRLAAAPRLGTSRRRARATASWDYRTFFKNLLGPFWVVFEVAYLRFIVLILAVFGAAAGAIGAALLGWPPLPRQCTVHRPDIRSGRWFAHRE